MVHSVRVYAIVVELVLHLLDVLRPVVVDKGQRMGGHSVRIHELLERRVGPVVHDVDTLDTHVIVMVLEELGQVEGLVTHREADREILIAEAELLRSGPGVVVGCDGFYKTGPDLLAVFERGRAVESESRYEYAERYAEREKVAI